MTAIVPTLLAVTSGETFLGSLLGFVLWILVMVWIYNIAKRKGRHPLGWVVLGFFFFLIALVILALLPSKRTTQEYEGRR
jgi:cbb3-type cytochrome oxidase subunit 3